MREEQNKHLNKLAFTLKIVQVNEGRRFQIYIAFFSVQCRVKQISYYTQSFETRQTIWETSDQGFGAITDFSGDFWQELKNLKTRRVL